MTANFSVVLDACVLIPMPLADTLLRLSAGPRLYLPKWTDRIMTEVSRSLRENFGLSSELSPYSITAVGPSAFLTTLYHINENAVIQVLKEQAAAINKSADYVLQRLRINAPHFVEMISHRF